MRILQLSISGKDGGGYIWQNVQHFSTGDDDTAQNEVMNALLDAVEATILDPYSAVMNESSSILNIGARFISPTTSYTINRGENIVGINAGTPAIGALAGKIAFYAAVGANSGRIFVAGPTDESFTLDQATEAYLTLLQSLGDSFLTFNGITGPFSFGFGVWSIDTADFTLTVAATAQSSPGVLSKRIRT